MDLALSNREADARAGSTKLKSMREEFECYLRDQLDGVTMIGSATIAFRRRFASRLKVSTDKP